MTCYSPEKIFIDRSVRHEPLALGIVERFPQVPTEYMDETFDFDNLPVETSASITRGKKYLFLTRQKGRFLRGCPETRNYICCNYYILNLANQCDLECSYCVLQDYLTRPYMIFYANTGDMLGEMQLEFESNSDKFFRVGTGQLTDSLSLDDLNGYSKILVPFFAGQKNSVLELKTKSNKIRNLEDLDHNRRTVVSWTLNAEAMAESEELKAATVDERLEAAAKCQEWGYMIGFHFDPLVNYDGWEEGYREIVDKIFVKIDPANIAWVSLGALRFMPSLKITMEQRFPKSKIIYNEFITGMDGKLRYFKPVRIEMFSKMVQWLRNYDKEFPIYLCMESQEIWEKVLGWRPGDDDDVGELLDHRIKALT